MHTTPHPAFHTLVAVGDSFTEGMSDPDPHHHGTYRGWADLLATRLAHHTPTLRYANLAVRGKTIRQITDEQIPTATTLGADLITLAGGLNDVLRPRCDVPAVCATLEQAADELAATGAHLILFRNTDPTRRLRSSARLMPRIEQLVTHVDTLATRHNATLVDLFTQRVFDDPRLWADDRLHLNTQGHQRVAQATAQALGLTTDTTWQTPLPQTWTTRRRADAHWARTHLGPWLARRATGRSSGDNLPPKRARPTPWP